MLLKPWEELPQMLKSDSVKPYYDALQKKKVALFIKRIFDIIISALLLICLSPIFVGIALAICLDSPGKAIFKQIRVTQYGREFHIFKFRTMVQNAEKLGSKITTKQDSRVTRIGNFLRKCRLDELPQLLNIFVGDMSFVGTRPEIPHYVKGYTPQMQATLLLPAGLTSTASIEYKDEAQLLQNADDVDKTYMQVVLPQKMKFNLQYLLEFSFWQDLKIIFKTAIAVL